MPDAIGDVSDDFDLGEVDGVYGGGEEVDVDDFAGVAVAHEEGGFLDDVVADVDDEVCVLDGAVEVVAIGYGGVSEEEV